MQFQTFCEIMDAIGNTNSNIEKMKHASNLLHKTSTDEELHAVSHLILGRVFPEYEPKKINVGNQLLWQVVMELSQRSETENRAYYRKDSDIGRLVEFALTEKKATLLSFMNQDHKQRIHDVLDIHRFFSKLATITGTGAQTKRARMLKKLLSEVSPCESKYLARIILEETRIGFREGLLEDAIAKAFVVPLDLVRRANMLSSNIGEVAVTARKGKDALVQVQLLPFRPIRMMLAEKAENIESALTYHQRKLSAEVKIDGVRAQAHKVGREAQIFSRRLEDISEAFPNILRTLHSIKSNVILDGELLGILEGEKVFFQDFTRRLRRKHDVLQYSKAVPAKYFVFDILWVNGESLFENSYLERRTLLQETIPNSEFIEIVPSHQILSVEEGTQLFEQAVTHGFEGLMLKANKSPYLAGRRGKYWLKLKKVLAELDLVIVAAEYGHGKRTGFLSDYYLAARDKDGFTIVGKTFKGLTDLEIQQMTEWLQTLTIQDEGWRVQVRPEIVVQVAFDDIQASTRYKSGFALRFARITAIREDKLIEDVDTLDTVRQLFESQLKRQRRANFTD
ncbi:MAG: ATP-dependent DNA ligase [Candidatus Heimdallarchaeota archaeon]